MNQLEHAKVISKVVDKYCEPKGYKSSVVFDHFKNLIRIFIFDDSNILFDEKIDYTKINIRDELIDYIDQKINPKSVYCNKEEFTKPYWTLEIVFRDNIKSCMVDVAQYNNDNGVLWYEERKKEETDDVVTIYIPLDRIMTITATEKFEEV